MKIDALEAARAKLEALKDCDVTDDATAESVLEAATAYGAAVQAAATLGLLSESEAAEHLKPINERLQGVIEARNPRVAVAAEMLMPLVTAGKLPPEVAAQAAHAIADSEVDLKGVTFEVLTDPDSPTGILAGLRKRDPNDTIGPTAGNA